MWLGQNRKGYFNLLKSKGQKLFHLDLKPNLEKLKIFIQGLRSFKIFISSLTLMARHHLPTNFFGLFYYFV
jgi:hypothetical protein